MADVGEEERRKLKPLLEALSHHRGSLSANARDFYDQQVERHAKYGNGMFLSIKQWAWLVSLYEQNCGPIAHLEEDGPEDDEPEHDISDDEISF